MRTVLLAVGLVLVVATFAPLFAQGQNGIVPISPPEQGFFSKKIVYQGIPIKAHKDVDDGALLEARRRLAEMLGNTPEIVGEPCRGWSRASHHRQEPEHVRSPF